MMYVSLIEVPLNLILAAPDIRSTKWLCLPERMEISAMQNYTQPRIQQLSRKPTQIFSLTVMEPFRQWFMTT